MKRLPRTMALVVVFARMVTMLNEFFIVVEVVAMRFAVPFSMMFIFGIFHAVVVVVIAAAAILVLVVAFLFKAVMLGA